jgi:hypothetical protein
MTSKTVLPGLIYVSQGMIRAASAIHSGPGVTTLGQGQNRAEAPLALYLTGLTPNVAVI